MGVVYEARELANDRVVALKVLLPELAEDERFRERFERESRIAMSLEHPHVVPVYAIGEADGVLYIAMRFVRGVDLRHLILNVGALPPARAVAIAEQVASGLDAAHKLGLVHRDVKPANVMVESLGDHDHCYVMDFGLAKHAGSTSCTQTGNWVGTLDYVAPEQILGGDVDARTDVYALGALLFDALTGRPPFQAGHDAAKLYAHLHSAPPDATTVRPDLAPEFDVVLGRALAKAPEERYLSAGDLGRAARAALTGEVPTEPERSVATGEAAVVTKAPRPDIAAAQPTQFDVTVGTTLAEARGNRTRLWPVLALLTAVFAIAAGVVAVILTSERGSNQHANQTPPAPSRTQPQPKPAHRVGGPRHHASTSTTTTPTTTTAATSGVDRYAVDSTGGVGPLVFNVANAADVVNTYGSPDFQDNRPPINTGTAGPPYQEMGYSCSTQPTQPPPTDLISVGTASNGSTLACLAVLYINLISGKLVGFETTDPKFHTTQGATPGMSTAEASAKEGQQATGGCFEGFSEQTPTAYLVMQVDGGQTLPNQGDAVVGGTVQSIELEATHGQLGLTFC
jgi:hypothetical protein